MSHHHKTIYKILAQYLKACRKKCGKIPLCYIQSPKSDISHLKFDEIRQNASPHYKAIHKNAARYLKACRKKFGKQPMCNIPSPKRGITLSKFE